MKPVVSFVGWHNAGKTTLLTRVARVLQEKGIEVAVIKHAHHGIDIDTANDSGNIFASGVPLVVAACADTEIVYRRYSTPRSLNQIVAEVAPYADLVITEGYKKAGYPSIEVMRQDISCEYLDVPYLIARVADFQADDKGGKIKVFSFEQVEDLALYLMEYFKL
ncbi:molybdopterin-guanine dinucleotide biosynthesis protein B [Thermosyntropha lipolytica DSM 11003]|uniref:Molybdopterin-guanine dinucleotide biosynthesis protein B n=1 Tax=Thermosyntropha lipolytica DSM 11003 TaxID=1123382 RepID=A0A1M5PI80_9FIRM|nr:molybdopterin-guanine dinucleotide biosynthesis protein B [Thermosyntropha lipolytica]SHH01438.1 molybdopterin-guanine dinucleotide biosynthesis protein B [Thermosyntropha lipolytica DSM 11003]